MEEIKALRSEVSALKINLQISETRRAESEAKMRKLELSGDKSRLVNVMKLECTRKLSTNEVTNLGLIWNLSGKFEAFKSIDEHMLKLNHACVKSGEHPVAILSDSERDTVSYPIQGDIKGFVDSDIIGHLAVNGQTEVEISSGFAGVKGNLLWFNSGDISITVRLVIAGKSKLILIPPGFGFSLGKRDKFTRVFLSSPLAPEILFSGRPLVKCHARAIFFGCSSDCNSWLNELDVKNPSVHYRQPGIVLEQKEVASDWNRRLGIEPLYRKRNSIRIAPMKGSNFVSGLLKLSKKQNSVL